MKAIRVHATGGPEVLRYEEVPVPVPGPGQLLVRVEAAGVNFIDVYHRTGLYRVQLPFTPGREVAGTVEGFGEGVTGFRIGDADRLRERDGRLRRIRAGRPRIVPSRWQRA